jgi:ABC-type Zn2+ transport system substrate-binding protein/surface adhesin
MRFRTIKRKPMKAVLNSFIQIFKDSVECSNSTFKAPELLEDINQFEDLLAKIQDYEDEIRKENEEDEDGEKNGEERDGVEDSENDSDESDTNDEFHLTRRSLQQQNTSFMKSLALLQKEQNQLARQRRSKVSTVLKPIMEETLEGWDRVVKHVSDYFFDDFLKYVLAIVLRFCLFLM